MKTFCKTIILSLVCLFFLPGSVLALNQVEKIGNPGLSQYPANTSCDCQARGVKELQYYNGRIYVGYGYWGYGGPPSAGYCGSYRAVKVWQIDPSGKLSTALQTSDEEVRHMFVEESKLFVSPADPMNTPSEAVFWILEGSTWQSASLRGAEKTFLLGFFQSALYAQLMQYGENLMKSADMGQTWKIILDYDVLGFKIGNAISMGDYLLMMGGRVLTPSDKISGIYKWYKDDSFEFYEISYPPDNYNSTAHQLSRFKDGVVYVLGYAPYDVFTYNSELLFLNQFYEGGAAQALSGFAESKNVIDAVVRGNTVYSLSVAPSTTNQFRGYIHSSTDLTNWTKEAEFIVPALPYAFEMLDLTGDFYVGLGDRNPDDGYADPESGSIYKVLDTEAPPPSPTVSQPPVITILGNNPLEHIRGNLYIDPGATAFDQEDGDITSRIVISGDVISASTPPGLYQIIFRVTDTGGLTDTKIRTVQVKEGLLCPANSGSIIFELIEQNSGQFLQGARVSLYDADGNNLGKFCITNNIGLCEIKGLTAGQSYSYKVERANYKTSQGGCMAGCNMPPLGIALTQAGPEEPPEEPLITPNVPISQKLKELASALERVFFYTITLGAGGLLVLGALLLVISGGAGGKVIFAKKVIKWSVIVLAIALSYKIIWAVAKSFF